MRESFTFVDDRVGSNEHEIIAATSTPLVGYVPAELHPPYDYCTRPISLDSG